MVLSAEKLALLHLGRQSRDGEASELLNENELFLLWVDVIELKSRSGSAANTLSPKLSDEPFFLAPP